MLSHCQIRATAWSPPGSSVHPRQEYWSGFPIPSPEDLPDLGIEPGYPAFQADSLPTEPPGSPILTPGVVCVCVIVAQSRLTLCNPKDCSSPGSSVLGPLQACILEWVAIPFSRGVFPTQGMNPGLPLCKQTLSSEPPGYNNSQKKKKICVCQRPEIFTIRN